MILTAQQRYGLARLGALQESTPLVLQTADSRGFEGTPSATSRPTAELLERMLEPSSSLSRELPELC